MSSETVEVREVPPGHGFTAKKSAAPVGYKQTAVRGIPEDWEVVALDALCTSVLDCHHSTPMWTTSGAVVIRNQNIREGRLDLSNPSFTDKKTFAERTRRAEPIYGDLVITREAPMGLVCEIPKNLWCCLGQRMVLLRPDHGVVDSRYLLYALLSEPVQRSISVAGGVGSTVSNLRIPALKSIEISTPKLFEQRTIATALSDVDALLEELDRLIAKKRDIKQATMQQLLTGQTRLPGFEEEWEVKRLGDLAEIVMGQSPSSSNYNVRGKGLPLIQGNADIANRLAIKRIFTTQITKRGQAGDILLSVRAPVGEVSKTGFDVCLGRGVCAIRFPNNFLYHYLMFLEPAWSKHSKGSTFDSVNSTDVKSVDIEIPSDVTEQEAIAKVLNDLDADLEALAQRHTKTAALKQAMMQELLTGRTRLVNSGV